MAHGRIRTGFSLPWVAKYNNADGAVSYSDARRLARGVSVDLSVTASEDNVFYADNTAAEKAPGTFTGGTAKLTVDGLVPESEELIYGLPEVEEVEVNGKKVQVRRFNDEMEIPYVGIGFVVRYLEEGKTIYVPTILRKAQFNTPGESAKTQEEDIDWQTQELGAALFRDDSPEKDWKWLGVDQETEAAAEAVIKAVFGVA